MTIQSTVSTTRLAWAQSITVYRESPDQPITLRVQYAEKYTDGNNKVIANREYSDPVLIATEDADGVVTGFSDDLAVILDSFAPA